MISNRNYSDQKNVPSDLEKQLSLFFPSRAIFFSPCDNSISKDQCLNAQYHCVNEGYASLVLGRDCKMKTGGQKTKTCKAGERSSPEKQKWSQVAISMWHTRHTWRKHTVPTNFAPTSDLSQRGLNEDDIATYISTSSFNSPSLLRQEWASRPTHHPNLQAPPHPTHPSACLTPHPLVNIPSLLKESHKTQSPLGRWCTTNPLAHSFRFQGKCWIDGQKFKDKKKKKEFCMSL